MSATATDRRLSLRSACSAAGFALFLCLALPGPGRALDINGFMPRPGTGTVAISYTDESYDEFWAGNTRTSAPPLGEVTTNSATVWFTWGFTDRVAVVANLPYVEVDTTGFAGFEESGLQDLTALVKVRLASRSSGRVRHSLVGAIGGRTPLSDYEGDLPVSLGDGSTDLVTRFVYHLEAGRFYLSQQVGYELRGDDVPDTFPLYTELGYTAGQVTWTAFYSRLIADGGTDIGDPGFTFPSNQEEYSRVGAKAYGRLNDAWGLAIQGFTTLDGRNSGDTTGFSAGLVLNF